MTRVWVALALLTSCGDGGSVPIDAADAIGLEAGLGMLTVVPSDLDLGPAGAGDSPWPVTITNTWVVPTAPLSTGLAGPQPDAFQIVNDTCREVRLEAGASCTLGVVLLCSSVSGGIHDAVLQVGAMPGGAVSVPLRGGVLGKSCIAILFVNPSLQAFGDVVVGATSAPLRFRFGNAGGKPSVPLTPTVQGVDPSSFTITASTCTGLALPPGAACTVDVAFAPETVGAKEAWIGVTSGFPTGRVTGTGVSPASGPP